MMIYAHLPTGVRLRSERESSVHSWDRVWSDPIHHLAYHVQTENRSLLYRITCKQLGQYTPPMIQKDHCPTSLMCHGAGPFLQWTPRVPHSSILRFCHSSQQSNRSHLWQSSYKKKYWPFIIPYLKGRTNPYRFLFLSHQQKPQTSKVAQKLQTRAWDL